MKLLLGLFSKYELRLLKQEKHTKHRIECEAREMASRFDDLANSTTSRLDDLANSTTSRLDDISYATASRLDDDVKVTLEEIDSKVRELVSNTFCVIIILSTENQIMSCSLTTMMYDIVINTELYSQILESCILCFKI